ncbi:glutathione S-transferase family protein [Ruegeria sp. 2012CJ41-6]|uniref:Glutathione S-transferase family protein n=1 Tax=Ruegeria spongiae TaxID=2942209 RepID=A0ABT0PYD0_9RHOB|nr:glutathione S-transferase family protein [Ruegeria spongiae]MCL6282623.1 glutathione S-transferase family protein [Ruegeria spongiae]
MLTIYAIPHSLYCAKLRIALRHKQLVWQEELPPDGVGSDKYRSIIPSGNLPTLKDGEFILGDSEAIIEYLEEAYPTNPLMPENPRQRAKYREMSRFHDTRLEPALRLFFPLVDPATRDQDIIGAAIIAMNARLQQLDTMLSGFDHERLRLFDCGYPITFVWLRVITDRLGTAVQWPENVVAYDTWLKSTPAIAEEIASYMPHVEDWLAIKLGASQ